MAIVIGVSAPASALRAMLDSTFEEASRPRYGHHMTRPQAGLGDSLFMRCTVCGMTAYVRGGRFVDEPGLYRPCTPPRDKTRR